MVHIFTHFKLNCTVAIAIINDENESLTDLDKSTYRFVLKKNMNDLALPSLIKKILKSLKKDEALSFLCLKCLTDVKIIAIFLSSAAVITSLSRIEPPG